MKDYPVVMFEGFSLEARILNEALMSIGLVIPAQVDYVESNDKGVMVNIQPGLMKLVDKWGGVFIRYTTDKHHIKTEADHEIDDSFISIQDTNIELWEYSSGRSVFPQVVELLNLVGWERRVPAGPKTKALWLDDPKQARAMDEDLTILNELLSECKIVTRGISHAMKAIHHKRLINKAIHMRPNTNTRVSFGKYTFNLYNMKKELAAIYSLLNPDETFVIDTNKGYIVFGPVEYDINNATPTRLWLTNCNLLAGEPTA